MTWIGRCPGDSSSSVTGTRPFATRGVSASPNNSCSFTASTGGAPGRYSSLRVLPLGTRSSVGASCSSAVRWRWSSASRNALPSSSASTCDARAQPTRRGSSHCSIVAASASSEMSGRPSSGAHARSESTRACHWRRFSLHGSAATPSVASPSRNRRAVSASRGTARVLRASCIASNRSTAAASTARVSAFHASCVSATKRCGNVARSHASSTGAARRIVLSRSSKRSSAITSQRAPRSRERSSRAAPVVAPPSSPSVMRGRDPRCTSAAAWPSSWTTMAAVATTIHASSRAGRRHSGRPSTVTSTRKVVRTVRVTGPRRTVTAGTSAAEVGRVRGTRAT